MTAPAGTGVFRFTAEVWLYPGMAGWHFISVPKALSMRITERFGARRKGWGSLPVMVTSGKTSWKTSIFPDRKAGAYLLPLKTEVRKKEKMKKGDKVRFTLRVRV